MKRGDKVVLFVDILGFASLTEDWPRRSVHRRHGSIRSSGTSESNNRLSVFHSVLDQTVLEFAKFSGTLTSMSFSDCAFVLLGNPYTTSRRFALSAWDSRPGHFGQVDCHLTSSAAAVSRAIFHGSHGLDSLPDCIYNLSQCRSRSTRQRTRSISPSTASR